MSQVCAFCAPPWTSTILGAPLPQRSAESVRPSDSGWEIRSTSTTLAPWESVLRTVLVEEPELVVAEVGVVGIVSGDRGSHRSIFACACRPARSWGWWPAGARAQVAAPVANHQGWHRRADQRDMQERRDVAVAPPVGAPRPLRGRGRSPRLSPLRGALPGRRADRSRGGAQRLGVSGARVGDVAAAGPRSSRVDRRTPRPGSPPPRAPRGAQRAGRHRARHRRRAADPGPLDTSAPSHRWSRGPWRWESSRWSARHDGRRGRPTGRTSTTARNEHATQRSALGWPSRTPIGPRGSLLADSCSRRSCAAHLQGAIHAPSPTGANPSVPHRGGAGDAGARRCCMR